MEQLTLVADSNQPRASRLVEPIARHAVIDGDCRYLLARKWGAGPLPVWVMLNPSTADGEQDDPTLWRIMGFAYRLGFDGLLVGNRYPYRSPSPAALRSWLRNWSDLGAVMQLGENTMHVADMLREAPQCFAAWGNSLPEYTAELYRWLDEIDAHVGRKIEWWCFGTNADGSPKHPLARGTHRIPDDMKPVRWARPG